MGSHEKISLGLLKSEATAWIDARARFDIVDSQAGLFGPGFVFRWPNGISSLITRKISPKEKLRGSRNGQQDTGRPVETGDVWS